MKDRYFEHIVGCLEASIKAAEDGVDCHIPVVIVQNAVDLLKEQEPVRCKDCKHYRINTVYPGTSMIMKYCAKTGIAEIKPDWFCADGEFKDS